MKRVIAVYGTLKRGHYNNRLLSKAKFLGEDRTQPNFTMRSNGGFPFVENKGKSSIAIEVFEINDEETSNRVNTLEGFNGIKGHHHNTFYDVTEIDTKFGKAEMFVAARDVSRLPLVEDGVW
jgi:gamma-glutamylcyclotransferase (GGCT)/AIG2-like uncharacterized protein YtfP